MESLLDHPAISGSYLFPQPRGIPTPFWVAVDGAKLACYHHQVDPDNLTLVHFHGNGEAVADYVPEMAEMFAELGLNSLFVEYREYGDSTGQAALVAMLGDGEIAVQEAGLSPDKVVAFGRSIGSLYAIELIRRMPETAGLILESGIADPAERFLAYADPVAVAAAANVLAEVNVYFDHKQKLSAYGNPVLVLHAENDGLIEISHAERNFGWAGGTSKRLVRFPAGDHNSIFAMNAQEYLSAIGEFTKSIA